MAIRWGSYKVKNLYDELLRATGRPRPAAQALCSYLRTLKDTEIEEYKVAAESAIHERRRATLPRSLGGLEPPLQGLAPLDQIEGPRTRGGLLHPQRVPEGVQEQVADPALHGELVTVPREGNAS